MESRGHCPACKCDHPLPESHAGKLAGATVGIAVGRLVDRSPWAVVIGAIAGTIAGEVVDRTIVPKCPTCGVVLEVIGAALR